MTLPSNLESTPERGTLDSFLANFEQPFISHNDIQGGLDNGGVLVGDPRSSKKDEAVGRAALQGQSLTYSSAGPHKIMAPQYQAKLGRSRIHARKEEQGRRSQPASPAPSSPPVGGASPLPLTSAFTPLERTASVSSAKLNFSPPLPSTRSNFRESVSAWAKPSTSSNDATTKAQQEQLAQTRQQMSMRRGKAPLAFRVMVLGSGGVGKTMWIKTFAESLQPHNDSSMRDGGRWTTEQQEQVEAFGMGGSAQNTLCPTSKLASLDGLEVVPSKAMHWNVVSRGESNQRARSPNFGPVEGHQDSLGRSRSRKDRSRASSVFLAHGASAPRTKVSLSMIDTPALPRSSVSIASSHTTRAPVHLRPIIDQITSRYMKTLQEEGKLNRLPTRSSSVEGQHVHCVLWFIDPREVLDGEWWYKMKEDEKSERQWKARAETSASRRPRAGSVAAAIKASAVPSARTSAHGRAETSSTSPKLDTSARLSSSKIKAKQSRETISGDGRGHRRDASEVKTRRGTVGSSASGARSPREEAMEILNSRETDTHAAELSEPSDATTSSPEATKFPLPATAEPQGNIKAADESSSTSIYTPTLSPTQRLTLRHLLPIVPIIPLIGRADTLTEKELQAVRRGVRTGWREVVTQLKREVNKNNGGGGGDKKAEGQRKKHESTSSADSSSSSSFNDYILDADVSEGEESGDVTRWEWDWLKKGKDTSADATNGNGNGDSLDDDQIAHSENGNGNGNGDGNDGRAAKSSHAAGSSDGFRDDHQEFMADDPSADSYDEEERRQKLRHGLGQARRTASAVASPHIDADDDYDASDPRFLLGVQDIVPSSLELRDRWPLAMFSPELDTLPSWQKQLHERAQPSSASTSTHPLFSRIYRQPLGAMQTLNPDHCDFALLRCILLGTHTGRILASSKGRYEIWRRGVISRARGGVGAAGGAAGGTGSGAQEV